LPYVGAVLMLGEWVDFHWEVDGKMYEFSLKGGDSISLAKLIEVLGISKNNVQGENKGDQIEETEVNNTQTDNDNSEEKAEYTAEILGSTDSEVVAASDIQISDATNDFMKDIDKVEFSDPELLWVGKLQKDSIVYDILRENGLAPFFPFGMTEEEYISCVTTEHIANDWVLISLKPFHSNEILTIKMKDGQEIIIGVTDEQNANMTTDEHGNEIVDTITNPAGTTFDLFDYWVDDSLKDTQGRAAWPGHAGNGNNFSYDYNGYDFYGNSINNLWVPSNPPQYNADGSLKYVLNPNGLRGNGNNKGINYNHAFKFSPSTGHTVLDGTLGTPTVDGTHKINSYTGNADPTTGLVTGTLVDGYPKLTNDSSLGTNGESLAYLFDSSSHPGKARYSGADHLLYVDEDGYYMYDSRDYWASFDTTSKNFTLTEQTSSDTTVRGFWPFGDRKYWVGMHMNTQFSIPVNGKVLNPKGVYKDMEFEFSGDDDTWLYIDGVLVGDGGGVHNRTNITINFNTGLVTVTGTKDTYGHAGTYTWTKYLDEIFRDAGRSTDGFDGHTFKAGTYHSFDMFYLERGGGESNLFIRYNLVSTADFTGHKEYHGETGTERLQRNQFMFDLIGLDGLYDLSGNPISGKENERAIMPQRPASTTTNPNADGAGTINTPLYIEHYSTKVNDQIVDSQLYRMGVTEDGNINFGSADIPQSVKDSFDPNNPPVYHYIVREHVPDEAVNAQGIKWRDASEEERKAGGFVLDKVTYDGNIYYMSAAVTYWRATDSSGNPLYDASGNPAYNYGLSKQYFTDETYTTQMDENHRFINFDNRYMEPLTLKIKKLNESGEKLPGADFKLSRAVYDENAAKWNVVSGVDPLTGTTDENGQLKFENLTAGNYILEETKVPEGYKDAKNKWLVTLTRTDTVTGEGENAVKKSHLEPTVTLLNKDGSVPAGASAVSETVVNHEFEYDILNEVKPPAEITVEKKWLDENGLDLEEHPTQITFKVYQLQHQHVWSEWTVTKEATEDEEGIRERTCTVDGEKQTEVIPKKDHVHVLTKVDSVAATCSTAGNIEYWECSKDHLKFLDAEGAEQIHEVLIPALGHDYQVTAETAATCTTEGSRTLSCVRCGDTYSESIPAIGHNWGDWINNGNGKEIRVCQNDNTHTEERDAQNLFPGTTDLVLVEKDDFWPVWGPAKEGEPDYIWKAKEMSVPASGIFEDQGNYYILINSFDGNYYSWSSFESQNKIQVSTAVSSISDWYSGTGNQQAKVPKGTLIKDNSGNYYVRTDNNEWSSPPESDGWYKVPSASGIQSVSQRRMSLAKSRLAGTKGVTISQNVPVSELTEQTLLESLGLSALNTLNEETGNKLIVYGSSVTTLATPVGTNHLWSINIPIEAEDEDGIAYKYYVIEDNPGTDYTTTYSGEENGLVDKGKVTITNKVKPKTGGLTITKAVTVNNGAVPSETPTIADGTYTFTITGPDNYSNTVSITVANGIPGDPIVLNDLKAGSYTISETGSTNVNGITLATPQTITIAAGSQASSNVAAFTNNLITTSIEIIKVEKGHKDAEHTLKCAKFQLTRVDANGNYVTGNGAYQSEIQTVDPNTGKTEFTGLYPNSRYKLEEKEAPAGYVLVETPWYITVDSSGSASLQLTYKMASDAENNNSFYIENEPGAALPHTGGPGTRLFTILGSILILGAGVLLWRRRRLI